MANANHLLLKHQVSSTPAGECSKDYIKSVGLVDGEEKDKEAGQEMRDGGGEAGGRGRATRVERRRRTQRERERERGRAVKESRTNKAEEEEEEGLTETGEIFRRRRRKKRDSGRHRRQVS